MQQHAGTTGAIAETSTPNCGLAFSCGFAAASWAPRGVHSYFISPLAKRPLLGKTNATDSSVLHLQRWFDAFPRKLVKSAKP